MSERKLHFETLQLHVGQEQADPVTDSRAVPIYQTTSYVFPNSQNAADRFALRAEGNIYGRLTNSTEDVFEKRIAALEGGVAALAVASGAAAIDYTLQALAQNGGHIVAQKTIYGGTSNLLAHTLPAFGVQTTFVNAHDLAEVEAAIQDNTRAVYIETLGNPNADIPDIDAIAAIAHKHSIPLVIDNTFGTPYLNRLLDANIEGYRAIRNAGHAILPKEDADFEGEKYRRTCLRFFKLMCATSLGKLCASDHAMNAIDEMSALNRDLRKFFDEHGAAYPVWQELEAEAGRYLQ